MRSLLLSTRLRLLKPLSLAIALLALALPWNAGCDSIKPLNFGPFFMNQVNFSGSPYGYDYALTNALYHFQVGWIEPLAEGAKGIFAETYFETDGNFNLSPFTSDIGTTFNLKPIRYLEVGLSYNRLLFHNSMVTFVEPANTEVPLEEWRPSHVIDRDHKEPGGADIFTFQANLTFDLGRTQFYVSGSRTLWDIDAKGRSYVFDYGDDVLIKPRDRVNSLLAQITLDLRPYSLYKSVSYTGLCIRDQYWYTTQTRLEKNLISAGITGFRLGQNPELQRRGLDLSVGYWIYHEQIPKGDLLKSLVLLGDWKWNIQFLKI